MVDVDGDVELLERWRAGDRTAGESLVTRHFAALRRFFGNKTSRDPDDLTQTTFLRCVEQRETFAGRGTFRAFLFGVARNVLYEHYRAVYRTDVDPAETSVADLDPTPSRLVSDVQWHRQLFDALRALPAEMQVLLELHYWEGLSTAELGEVFGSPQGTIKSRLHAARAELRERCRRRGVDLGVGLQASIPGWARDLADLGSPRGP